MQADSEALYPETMSTEAAASTGDPTDEFVVSVFSRNCPSRAALEDIGSKWGILALLALRENPFRFNALRRRVEGVSEKMLSQTLHTLERDGLVVRDVHSSIPPRVEYSLTELGARIAARVHELTDLLEASVDEMTEARRAYDSRQGR